MGWEQIEATHTHLTYIIVAAFITVYCLFSVFIRNRMHMAEPPLATLTGIAFGPSGARAFDPEEWQFSDETMQEITRVIAGLQVFVVGLELPRHYMKQNWVSLLWLLGPVMAFGWLVCAAFIYFILDTSFPAALVISACLTPTDPVLAASILSNSLFSTRVPKRMRHLLSCESGCNDGVAFPFLFVGISILTRATAEGAVRKWFFITILWQCVVGTVVGIVFGLLANIALRFSDKRRLIGPASFVVFYLILAFLSIGIASTLGLDDFLVAFAAGTAFSHDGWFAARTRKSSLNNILDLIVNSSFFIYFGAVIPWSKFLPGEFTPNITPARLGGLLILVLVFRRLPALFALKPFIPNIRTYYEAAFAGHFGPMGVGALFLAIEARAQLETGTSQPMPKPDPSNPNIRNIELIFPVISFIVLGSIMVHGLSVAVLSLVIHFRRSKDERAGTVGAETEPIGGMEHESESDDTADEEEQGWEAEWRERRNRIFLPTDT